MDEFETNAHRKFSAECFNESWTYLDQDSPNPTELLACVYASYWHWKRNPDAVPDNMVTANWLIVRAYSKLNIPGIALLCASECIALCETHQLGALECISAYEAMARALILENRKQEALQYRDQGLALLERKRSDIGEQEYGYCLADLNEIPLE